jgi:hypothetical protein
MANVTITLMVPEERLDAVYAAAAGSIEPAKSAAQTAETADWYELAPRARRATMGIERGLLRRLAYARGQRVPVAELVRDFGLPSQGSLEQDFPRLKAFCAEDPANRRFPVVAGGDGSAAWYWMAVVDAAGWENAFSRAEANTDPGPEAPSPRARPTGEREQHDPAAARR